MPDNDEKLVESMFQMSASTSEQNSKISLKLIRSGPPRGGQGGITPRPQGPRDRIAPHSSMPRQSHKVIQQ